MFALTQPRFILAVKSSSAPDYVEDAPERVIIGDQRGSGRRSDKHLNSGNRREPFELAKLIHVLRGAPDEEAEITVHAMPSAGDFVSQRGRGGRGRHGVRHFEHGSYPPEYRRQRAA